MMFLQCKVFITDCSISIMLNYVVKKGHEQVEKTLETKKWSRNGKVIKQGRNVYDAIHAQWLYFTLRYNIKGTVATSRAMPTPFFFLGFLKHYVD